MNNAAPQPGSGGRIHTDPATRRIIVAITGATGAIFGIRLLEVLAQLPGIQTHLIMSKWAKVTIENETGYTANQVAALADHHHSNADQAASVSSGSFLVDAMVVVPCSMKTLAQIRLGLADELVARAADVTLKEGRQLVLVPREIPFNQAHLEHMLALARQGVRIAAPVPAFYNRPESVEDIVDHIVGRILDQLGIHTTIVKRWNGLAAQRRNDRSETAQ